MGFATLAWFGLTLAAGPPEPLKCRDDSTEIQLEHARLCVLADGRAHGAAESFYPNGALHERLSFDEGELRFYDELDGRGRSVRRGHYFEGRPNNHWEWYHPNGNTARTVYMSGGAPSGMQDNFDEAGRELDHCWWMSDVCRPHWQFALMSAFGDDGGPQVMFPVWLGVAGNGTQGRIWDSSAFTAGVRPAFVYQFVGMLGAGAYLEALTTDSFDSGQLGGGATLRLSYKVVSLLISGGAFAQPIGTGWEPGFSVSGFLGFVFPADAEFFGLPFGLRVDVRQGVGDSGATSVLVVAEFDGLYPFVPLFMLGSADWAF